MFAFPIWNPATPDVRAATHTASRPLYVADDGSTFRAASTVKALLAATTSRERMIPRARPDSG